MFKLVGLQRSKCNSYNCTNVEVNLKVPELFNPHVNLNMNSIWKLVDKVIEGIENLEQPKL